MMNAVGQLRHSGVDSASEAENKNGDFSHEFIVNPLLVSWIGMIQSATVRFLSW